jgi:hypothetical protein
MLVLTCRIAGTRRNGNPTHIALPARRIPCDALAGSWPLSLSPAGSAPCSP